MRLQLKLTIYILIAVFPRCAFAQLGADTARAIDALFERYRPEAPGCELAISRNGKVIYSKAWGMADLEHHVPMTTTAISEAGSVSKQFTAAAILLLEQQGKLSLDDEIHKYIPKLPDYGKPILLRYMMHHSSGLRDWGSVAAIAGWARTTKTYNNNDALDIIVHQQNLNTPPNEAFGYSNSNYNLFAILVERVSGMSLAAFTRQSIFLPAGMTHTSWRDDHKRVVPDRAIAYDLTRNIYETNLPNEDVYGNGGLLTTAEDLLKWNAWYLGGHFGNPSLLSKQLAVDNFNNGKPNEYGAGLFFSQRYGQQRIEHSGATASYRADLEAFPASGVSIAWLSNTSAFDGKGNIFQQVEELFFAKSGSGTATAPGLRNLPADTLTYSLSVAAMQAYAGKYYSEEAQAGFTVLVKGGSLYLYRSPQTMIPLTPKGKDRFSTGMEGFSGDKGEIVFLSGNKQMSISVSRAAGVIFNKL
jgi:CubicO group peptidase (beta-lactamase class C family)